MAVLLTLFSHLSLATTITAATIYPNTLSAEHNQTAIVNIKEFGRYIIQAKSEQGVAFGLNDKKYGKGIVKGVPNKVDGRYSGFLDVGQYQLFTKSSDANTNQVVFNIQRSQAINKSDVSLLKDVEIQTLQLKNAQHYDFAIEITKTQTVSIEAAGRNLEALQLFNNGQWLIEANIKKSTIYPVDGKPLERIQLTAKLQPGMYRLSAYGGQALKWAVEEDSNPLYLRKGVKSLALDSTHNLTISPFGEDIYYMQAGNDSLNVNLAIKSKFNIGLSSINSDLNVFASRFNNSKIIKEMKIPSVSIKARSSDNKVIKFTGVKGQKFSLTSLLKKNTFSNFKNASYTVSSLSINDPHDYADVTWYSKEYNSTKSTYHITDFKAVNVSKNTHYRKRFNVNDDVKMLLNIETSGEYEIISHNKLSLFYKIEPVFYSKDSNFDDTYKRSNLKWKLNKGLYVLTIRPKNKGLLDIIIKNTKMSAALSKSNNSVFKQLPQQALINHKKMNTSTTLVMLDNDNILGFDIRETKVKLKKPMSLYLLPNQSIKLQTLYVNNGVLQYDEKLASKVSISINGKNKKYNEMIKSYFRIQPTIIKNTSKETIKLVVKFIPNKTKEEDVTKVVTQSILNKSPQFEELNVTKQPFFKLDGIEQFSMKVAKAGLYAIESTGLLATSGAIRNKLNEKYQDTNQNGSGRNFYIQSYLLPGEYQLAMQNTGNSKGNTSVVLSFSPIIDKGQIKLGAKYFENLKNTESLKYKVIIKESGRYSINALTVDEALDIRLDDKDGWPVIKPGSNGSRVEFLEKGEYFISILPKPVTVSSSLLVEKVTNKMNYPQNDKVKKLILDAVYDNNKINYTWLERLDEQENRISDRWQFELNTDANITIGFSDTMSISLFNVKNSTQNSTQTFAQIGLFDIKEGYKSNSWNAPLEKGLYELRVVAKGKNNQLPYEINVSNRSLLFGQNKPLSLPQNVDFKLTASEQISISTFGQSDVIAKLFDSNNQLLESFDDVDENWNLMLNTTLKKGEYRLELDSLTKSKSTMLSFEKPSWNQYEELLLPVSKSITAQNNIIVPLVIMADSTDSDVLNVVVDSKQKINVSIEEFKFNAWQEISYQQGEHVDILIPMKSALKPLRVKIFSSLNQLIDVEFNAANQSVAVFNQADLIQEGINAQKILDQSNWYVAKIEDLALSQYSFERKIKTSDNISQALNNESVIWLNQHSTLWVASKQPGIKAKLDYLRDVEQVQLQQNDQAIIVNDTQKDQVLVTHAAVMQDHASIYYQSKKQDKQNSMAMDLNYSITSTLHVAKDEQALILKNGINPQRSMLVKLNHLSFDIPKVLNWNESFSSVLNVGQSFALELPQDNRNTQIIMPPKTLVQFVLDDQIQASFYSEQIMQTVLFNGQADSVYLFGLDSQAQPFAINKIERFEQAVNNSNYQILDVKQTLVSYKDLNNEHSKRQYVEVSHPSFLLDENMNIQKGYSFKINNDAKLYIQHDGHKGGIWQSDVLINTDEIKAKALSFQSEYELTENTVLNTQDIKHTLLKITSDQLINIHLIDQRGGVIHKVVKENDTFSVFVGDNLAFIEIQLVSAKPAKIQTQSIHAEQMSEGVGQLNIIASAKKRLYKFNMQHDGSIGFANRSDSDQLKSTLYDKSGHVIQSANVLMQTLLSGEYWVLIENVNTNKATQFEPVLLGSQQNNAVDVNTINQYKKKAGWVK